MKIGILTQPLRENYGGLLQAFALQFTLKKMGHKACTIDMHVKETPFFIKVISLIRRLFFRLFLKKSTVVRVWPTLKEQNLISRHTSRFINQNICTTERIYSLWKFPLMEKYEFNAIIVGSDQVWRPDYSPCLTNYFLDFINKKYTVKRIAYAASFGVDNWGFSIEQTTQCAMLAKNFNAISVREDSAVKLSNDNLGVDAVHVLDPTMLLTKEDYEELVVKDQVSKSKGNLMIYVLDKSYKNTEIIQQVAIELGLIPFSLMPLYTFSSVGKKYIKDCVFPPVTEWLRGFMDADFVITDSFHGTVFSIIFNKPFLSIGNAGRGVTRFTSLLKIFGLENRLVLPSEKFSIKKIKGNIDFDKVNQILSNEKKRSKEFLFNALNNYK